MKYIIHCKYEGISFPVKEKAIVHQLYRYKLTWRLGFRSQSKPHILVFMILSTPNLYTLCSPIFHKFIFVEMHAKVFVANLW
jgi:hypothetical protein